MIKPSIGRQVWFRGIPWGNGGTPVRLDANQAMAATIVYVHNDRSVNLVVIDHAGQWWPMHSVTLVQAGEDMDPGSSYAEWMPYQLGQAQPSLAINNIFTGVQLPMPKLFDSLARGTSWPELQPNISMSETLAGTGQLSQRTLQ